jgi:hypothetical protein
MKRNPKLENICDWEIALSQGLRESFEVGYLVHLYLVASKI